MGDALNSSLSLSRNLANCVSGECLDVRVEFINTEFILKGGGGAQYRNGREVSREKSSIDEARQTVEISSLSSGQN